MENINFKTIRKSSNSKSSEIKKGLKGYFLGLFSAFILSFSLVGIILFIWIFAFLGPKSLKIYLEEAHVQELKDNIESAKSFL